MTQGHVGINVDYGDWDWSTDAGERARLLQSPNVETVPKSGEGRGPATTSTLGAVFIVVNAALGAGLLNFPAAFSTAGGVAAGIALQMCMLVFIIGGLVILAYCSQASNERTYQEVVWAVCGRVAGVLCEVAIAVYTFGTCIAFLIIIGDQQDKIIAALVKDSTGAESRRWYTDRKFTISLTAFLFILPLSVPKEIGFQKYASCLSVVGTWYVTAIVIIKYIWPDREIVPGEITTSPSSWMAVFNAMPTICFGFQISKAYGILYGIGLNMYNLYATCWGGAHYQDRYEADLSNLLRYYQFNVPVPKVGSIPGVPKCINATAMYVWLNRDDVRQALHIPSALPNWELCSSQVTALYERQYTDMAPFYKYLLAQDLRALVYNGDVDMACNFLGGEKFVASLNQPVLSDYQPWYFNDQVAGFFKEYEKITFLTVKGAGHMVPQYKPGQALKMFEHFLSRTTYV